MLFEENAVVKFQTLNVSRVYRMFCKSTLCWHSPISYKKKSLMSFKNYTHLNKNRIIVSASYDFSDIDNTNNIHFLYFYKICILNNHRMK